MPRISRNCLKTKFFHVITQGINKSYIFEQSMDIKVYIKYMYELKDEFNIKIISYCIMNNHAHMLLEVESINYLSKYMHKLNTKYALYYNEKYDRVGYVFKNRFKSEGIYGEKHLKNCIKYIYNNPVKAKICNSPEEYLYSNYDKKIMNIDMPEEFVFVDVDENKKEICKNVISVFLEENELNIKDLKNDKIKLKILLKLLHEQYKISFQKISDEININRETLRQISKM